MSQECWGSGLTCISFAGCLLECFLRIRTRIGLDMLLSWGTEVASGPPFNPGNCIALGRASLDAQERDPALQPMKSH